MTNRHHRAGRVEHFHTLIERVEGDVHHVANVRERSVELVVAAHVEQLHPLFVREDPVGGHLGDAVRATFGRVLQ